jgi:23S rRNA (uridine2552-2'-O)-methyltransferase
MTGVKKPGGRALKVRLKTAKQRTKSSQAWLERQINDPYVRAAKAEGYRSRAAYKLAEMDDKHRFLKRGQSAVDLGAAPGVWTQVLVARLGEGRVVGVDFQ